jgi:four helix bundle protein
MASSFRDLVAYRLAGELSDEIARAVAGWDSFEKWSIGIQLARSADSIGANIAEALGRWHTKDRRHLLMVARGSLYETEHWLIRAETRGLWPGGVPATVDEIGRTLNGLINRAPPS